MPNLRLPDNMPTRPGGIEELKSGSAMSRPGIGLPFLEADTYGGSRIVKQTGWFQPKLKGRSLLALRLPHHLPIRPGSVEEDVKMGAIYSWLCGLRFRSLVLFRLARESYLEIRRSCMSGRINR